MALRTAAGVTWLASDHQGTAQLAVDSTSLKVTQRRQTPFGAPRGAADFPGEKGFVGGTIDVSTGLTNLGAREYDTLLGRFISVDPIMDLADPQQMHGYTYSNNNPITHADPTGLWWSWSDIKEKVTTVTKYAAPILGGVAILGLVAGVAFASPFLLGAAAIATTAGLVVGAVNAANACLGGGSGVDCAMEVAGLVPGVGRIAGGAKKVADLARARSAFAATQTRNTKSGFNDALKANKDMGAAQKAVDEVGTNPHQWLDKVSLGPPGNISDMALLSGNTSWSMCGIQAPQGTNCMGLPTMNPFGPTQPIGVNNKNPFIPTRNVVYPANFIGPIPRGAVRGVSPVFVPKPAAPPAPAPAPGRNYTTSDGRLCNTRGGMCAS